MIHGYQSLARNKKAPASISSLLFIISSIVSVTSREITMDTVQRTLPAYAVALDAETTLNSSVCRRELGVFKDAVDIRTLWALKVLDSSGEPMPGFMYGNNYWLGSRTQCFDNNNKNPFQIHRELLRNASRFKKTEDEFPPYKLNYFVVVCRTNSTLQYHMSLPMEDVVILGLCLPDSCTTHHLRPILEKIYQERTLMISELYGADFKLENIRDLQLDDKLLINGRIILFAFILIITLFVMIAATVYDILVYQKYLRGKTRSIRDTCHSSTSTDDKLTINITESVVPVRLKRPNLCGEVLMCFSVYTNTKIIFDIKSAKDTIKPIHGIRFFGMMWIILIHTVYYPYDFMDNKPWSMRLSEGHSMQILTNGSLSVDTFFFLSGFLMAYRHFKQDLRSNTEDGNRVNHTAKLVIFLKDLLHRFLRLTPAFMMMIGIVEIHFAAFGQTSSFSTSERPQEICPKYWWRNLLYIHNLFPREDMCLSWTWYLSADMQFHIIGTFLVILSSIYFYTAVTILLVIFLSSTILSGYISYINGYVPTLDEVINTLSIMYGPPWMRIGPYIVGIVTSYTIVKLNNKLTLQKRKVVALWVLGSAINMIDVYCMRDKQNIPVLFTAFYIALHRKVWGISIAWLLIACCTNHAGIVNTILTLRPWIPLSKLTYCAYLLNPFVIKSIYLQSESPMHVDFTNTFTTFLGQLVITYGCSYIYSLMMETPYIRIVKLLTKSRM